MSNTLGTLAIIASACAAFFWAPRTRSSVIAPDYQPDLALAAQKLKNHTCPECERLTTITCVEGNRDEGHVDRCGKCGAMWRYDARGTLVEFVGYFRTIREHYLKDENLFYRKPRMIPLELMPYSDRKALPMAISVDRELETMRNQAVYELERQARRAA